MPELIWLYPTALLYNWTSATCVALAEALETVSHDRLTRMLQSHWSWHTRLELACRPRGVGQRGALIRDDTVLPQPVATAMESWARVFSRQERRPVTGVSLGLLGWTDGRLRIPRGLRRGRRGGPSTDSWALEWRSEARHRLRSRPDAVLCEAWDPAQTVLKRLRDDGWSVVGRLLQNRRGHDQPLRTDRRPPSGAASGGPSGGLKIWVVRDGAQDNATHRLPLTAAEVRRWDLRRAPM
jgi:hypothetical protein